MQNNQVNYTKKSNGYEVYQEVFAFKLYEILFHIFM